MDWSLLTDACGPADHLPALLERFAADPAARWPELMDHLCPQLDTAYPASWAALPRLAQIAAAHDGTTHAVPVLSAAGAIASCAPGPGTVGGPLDEFATPLGELHRLATGALSRAADQEQYVLLLSCLLSFEGVEVWDRCLDGLHTGEYEACCPWCGLLLEVELGTDLPYCADAEYSLPGEPERVPLRPAGPDRLGVPAAQLYARAVADGWVEVARAVLRLFGSSACPDCGTEFVVAVQVAAARGFGVVVRPV
ncbi:hypothetical protein ACFYS8_33315 [Kitasatospora sp. NPDC004615]|uniref:hypothetical protein n=1 Tax=Kitasatospora sp. NPDC004615 TaxID=3364017 RepID=UPI0036A35A97